MCGWKYIDTKTLTPHISKFKFLQPGGTGIDVTQKQKVIDLKIGTYR